VRPPTPGGRGDGHREEPAVFADGHPHAQDGAVSRPARKITSAWLTADTRKPILTSLDLDHFVYAALRAGASHLPAGRLPPADCSPRSGSSPRPTRCSPRSQPAVSSTSSRAARSRTSPAILPRPRRRERTGTRGTHHNRPRPQQHRDRADRLRQTCHCQDPHQPATGQTRRPRPLQLVIVAYETSLVRPS
jgi:hypothetical protein